MTTPGPTTSPQATRSNGTTPALNLNLPAGGLSLLLLALAACWLLFFNELRGEWEINAQYSYGYVVPLLGAILVWRRWPERPPVPPRRGAGLVAFVSAGLLLFLLPLRLVLEANPEWRLAYWLHGFQALGLTFCFLYWLGGWRWVRFFAPPIAFMLIAVPWPMGLEQSAIQGLMRFVAGMTVAVADWLGIPAVQHGNLVEVGVGVVGIDEACSGVRSLQSALMLSLFLGEMHRFSIWRRLSLLGGSLLFVVAANLTRTTFLVWAAASRGMRQMEAWHDTAGLLVMVIVLPSLLLLAHLMRPKKERGVPAASGPFVAPRMPRWVGLSVIAWIGVTEAATEAWYRTHEAHLIPNERWVVAWPAGEARFKKSEVPETSLTILRCSSSQAASWEDDEGNEWSGFFLRWDAGKNSEQLAKGHRPDICFPAAGAELVGDLGQLALNANGVSLIFKHQTFESGDRLLHVFYCLSSDYRAPDEKPLLEDGSQASRLRAVLAGKRHLGQQVAEFVLVGPETSDEAVALFTKQLPTWIRRG
jgi:exosortase